jgi:hypothetical protein
MLCADGSPTRSRRSKRGCYTIPIPNIEDGWRGSTQPTDESSKQGKHCERWTSFPLDNTYQPPFPLLRWLLSVTENGPLQLCKKVSKSGTATWRTSNSILAWIL